MADRLIQTETLIAIADAIREKNGENVSYTPSEMPEKIQAINNVNDNVITFSQVNPTVAEYLTLSEYENDPNYTIENITNYEDDSTTSLEKPAGYALTILTNGTIFFLDEINGDAWSDTVNIGTYMVYNLTPGHIWRWWVKNNNGITVQNGKLQPTGNLRMIYLQYPHNWRDLGGWSCDGGKIRYGLLYRGAQLSYNQGTIASATDIKRLRNLKIRYEIDLRTLSQTSGRDEVIGTGDDLIASIIGDDVYYLKFPYSDASYTDIISLTGPYLEQTKKLIQLIVNNVIHKEPTYYHCQAGADRTGVISAMLEGLCGVSQADLDRDFELTSFYPTYERTRLNTNWKALMTYINAISGSTLRDKFVQWFLNMGVSIDELNAFRAAAIDGTPSILDPNNYDINYSVINNLPIGITSNNNSTVAARGANYTAILTADTSNNIAIGDITVNMDGVDITEQVVTLTPYVLTTTYTINNMLTNVTNNNIIQTVNSGDNYVATLTANNGFTLDTVTITMGGIDITSTVYSSGTINIPNVTGNIIITATATQATRTNLLPLAIENDGSSIYPTVTHPSLTTIGYASGYRIGSGGTESAASGKYVTGFIPVHQGDTVIFENIHANTATQDNNYIAFYNSSFTLLTSCSRYVSAWYSQSGNAIKPVEADSNGWLTSFTVTGTSTYNLANVAYFRVAANLIDDTSAIYIE